MRKISIYPGGGIGIINRFYIVYDGPHKENHRKDYNTIEELVEKMPTDLNLNLKKPLEVQFGNYSPEEREKIKTLIGSRFKKVSYSSLH